MTARPSERFVWDATGALESLGAAGVVLWMWDPARGSMRLTGPARGLGLGPLAPECSTAALLALAMPQDRMLVQDLLEPKAPGAEIVAKVRMRNGPACIWRGVWLEEGGRAAGAIVAETQFAPEPRDSLTGLLDRRTFLAQGQGRIDVEAGHAERLFEHLAGQVDGRAAHLRRQDRKFVLAYPGQDRVLGEGGHQARTQGREH